MVFARLFSSDCCSLGLGLFKIYFSGSMIYMKTMEKVKKI